MMGPRTNFGTNIVQPGSVPAYAQGGAVDTSLEDNPMMRGMGAQLQVDINSALGVVKDVLSYGRSLHGLGGGGGDEGAIKEAQMPSTPFRETPVPQPMPKPNSFPYGPNEKPFGKRLGANEQGDREQEVAAFEPKVLPGAPFSETPKPQPMPGPLPPTSNPFGKRVSENSGQSSDEETETPQQEMAEGAIDTDEETA